MTTMGLLAITALVLFGAFAYRAAATFTLVAAMSLMQERLGGTERSLGVAAVHVSTRLGLSLAVLVMGAAADLAPTLKIPFAARPSSVQLVLAAAGMLVVLGGVLAHDVGREVSPAETAVHPHVGARAKR